MDTKASLVISWNMSTCGQRRSYALVREQHALNITLVNCRNSALFDGLKQLPTHTIGGWVWVYNTAANIRQGAKAGPDAKVLKAKFSHNQTGPFKVVAVGHFSAVSTPDGRPLAANLLYLDLSTDAPVERLWSAANLAPAPTTAPTSHGFCQQG